MTNPVVHRRTSLYVCNVGNAHAETNRHLFAGCDKALAAASQIHIGVQRGTRGELLGPGGMPAQDFKVLVVQ